jgi:hypothetical protein
MKGKTADKEMEREKSAVFPHKQKTKSKNYSIRDSPPSTTVAGVVSLDKRNTAG